MHGEPLPLLLAIPLELLVFGVLAPLRGADLALARTLARLDKPERGDATRRVRGGIILGAAVLAAGAAGWLLEYLSHRIGWPVLVQAAVLALTLRSGTMARAIMGALVDADYQRNRERVSVIVRALVEGLLAPALYYLLFGLAGAAVFRAASSVTRATAERPVIGTAARRLQWLLLALPGVLGAVLLVLASVFAPGGNSAGAARYALFPGRAAIGIPGGRAVAAAAGTFGIAIEGQEGWIGPAAGRARLVSQDVLRSAVLCGVAGLLFIVGLILGTASGL